MTTKPQQPDEGDHIWDEDHVKALLNFPRYPLRLIQEEPWQTWISQRGGLKGVYTFLREYAFAPSHRRILEVVLSKPEEVSDVYANQLNISRATYFYRLKELVPAVVHALNQWVLAVPAAPPPVSTTTVALPKIPTPLTGLVGADSLLESLHDLLARDDIRLLTLLGPGGVGKTRLSIELANQMRGAFADQVAFVDLSPVRGSEEMLNAIAHTLGLAQSGEESVQAFLMPRKVLLVLDNFEHLLEGASIVSDLLMVSPDLKVMVTSRAALRIYGEAEFIVPPLATPTPDEVTHHENVVASPAVALFIQRARAVNPAFALNAANVEAIAELCMRMDGIPLAIELAAYQAKYYSPQAMLVRLSNSKRLNFLNQGPKRMHAHQQTPRDILNWSYRLLSPELQTLFNRLAVFVGGCTIDAAETVCGDNSVPVAPGMAALADQSLLQQYIQSDGEPRYLMLGITREYGLEQLDQQGETLRYEQAHADYYLHFAEAPYESRSLWLDAMRRERLNLNAAINWFLAQQQSEGALRLAAALWDTWRYSGAQQEGYLLTRRVLELTEGAMLPSRDQVLHRIGWLARDLGDISMMQWAFQSMMEIAKALNSPHAHGVALIGMAEVARIQGRWTDATTNIDEAMRLVQEWNDQERVGRALIEMGRIAMSQGDLDTAIGRYQESIAQVEAWKLTDGKSETLCYLGQAHYYAGMLDQAALVLEEALHLKQAEEDAFSADAALAQITLAHIDAHQGRLSAAVAKLDAAMVLSKRESYLPCIELAHHGAALIAMQHGDDAQVRRSLRESLLIQESLKEGWRCFELLEAVAQLMIQQAEPLSAARLFGASEHWRAAMGVARMPLDAAGVELSIAALREQLDSITLEDAWLAGQGLSVEQALIYALRCLE